MFIKQIIKFELRGPWPPARTCTPTTGYFYDKTKISSSGLLFAAKILQDAMYLTFSYWGQITSNI